MHPDYATSLHNLGTLHYKLQGYPKAEALIGKAYTIWCKALGKAHPHAKIGEKWLEVVREKLKEGDGEGRAEL